MKIIIIFSILFLLFLFFIFIAYRFFKNKKTNEKQTDQIKLETKEKFEEGAKVNELSELRFIQSEKNMQLFNDIIKKINEYKNPRNKLSVSFENNTYPLSTFILQQTKFKSFFKKLFDFDKLKNKDNNKKMESEFMDNYKTMVYFVFWDIIKNQTDSDSFVRKEVNNINIFSDLKNSYNQTRINKSVIFMKDEHYKRIYKKFEKLK